MKKKNWIVSAVAVATALAVLAGCGGTDSTEAAVSGQTEEAAAAESDAAAEPSGEAAITDGYYTTSISGLQCFLRFNEDGTYYGYYFDGGVTDAGTYEVQDKELDYYETYNEDETPVETSKKTAPQVVALTSYTSGETQEIAFDGDRLCDFTVGGMSGHVFMDHDAAYEYVAEDMEPAIAVQTLYFNNDAGMTLTLYHDRTFVDYTGDTRVSGTWDPADNGYTLTTDNGEEWTLTIDGSAAVCQKGDEAQELTTTVGAGTVVAEFTSDTPIAVTGVPGMEGPTDCDVRVAAYDDGTAEVIANIFENNIVVDSGTYTVDTSGPIPAYTFAFANAGEVAAEPDYASATENSILLGLTYVCTDAACTAEIGGAAMDLTLSMEAPLSFTYTMGG